MDRSASAAMNGKMSYLEVQFHSLAHGVGRRLCQVDFDLELCLIDVDLIDVGQIDLDVGQIDLGEI